MTPFLIPYFLVGVFRSSNCLLVVPVAISANQVTIWGCDKILRLIVDSAVNFL